MKKTFFYLSLLLLTLGSSSCKEYLDVKPYGKVIPKTAEEFSALIHTQLRKIDMGDNQPLVFNLLTTLQWELYADNFEPALRNTGNGQAVWIGHKIEGYLYTQSEYEVLYSIIKDCNIIIGKMPKDGNQDMIEKTLGTAYAIRGLAYYNLMRLFCSAYSGDLQQMGLPIVTKFDVEAKIPRSTMQDLFSIIESDFQKAISYKVTDADFLFTEDVSRALLVRHYFWAEEWQKAIDTATPLLSKYPLLEGEAYKSMMTNPVKSGNTFIKTQQASNTVSETSRRKDLDQYPISIRFASLFSEDEQKKDIRYDFSMNEKRIVQKPIFAGIRAAELYLIVAESYYHLGKNSEALKSINEFRAKRITSYTPLTEDNLPEINSHELIKVDALGKPLTKLIYLILSERRKELFMEGDRFFELKRNGSPEFWKAERGNKLVTESFMYTLPIPLKDLKIMDITQNPGYDKYTIGLPKK